jgi:hypothetical protein
MNAILKTKPATVADLSAARVRKLVERAAELESLMAPLKAELDEIKDFFREQPLDTYQGKTHKIVVSLVSSTRLDLDAVKGRLSPADYVDCTYIQATTRVQVKLLGKD